MRRRYHLHPPGLLYLLLVVAVGLAASNRPGNMLIWVFSAMLSGVLLSGVLSGQPLMSVRAVRSVPRTGRVGEPVAVRYSVSNGSRLWPLFGLFVRELEGGPGPRAFVQHVGPGETVVAESVRWPDRRGPLRFGAFRVETTFPFGLVVKSVRFDGPAECLVLPRVVRLRPGLLEALAGGTMPGQSSSGRAGTGSDFLGIREYRPGDSARQIAWRRSASAGTLAVVERSVDLPRRLSVVLDLRRATADLRLDAAGPPARWLEEDAISLAASILTDAQRAGFETRLSVLGVRTPSTPARRGHWHLRKQLAALAGIDLDAPRDAGARPGAERDRVTTFVVSADRASVDVGGADAVRLTAGQLGTLAADGPREGSR